MIFKLIKKENFGATSNSILPSLKINSEVFYFTNKNDAKKIQNTFNGDRIIEVKKPLSQRYIYSLNHLGNFRTLSVEDFKSIKEAENFCETKQKFDYEIIKHKVYKSYQDFQKNYYSPKLIKQL